MLGLRLKPSKSTSILDQDNVDLDSLKWRDEFGKFICLKWLIVEWKINSQSVPMVLKKYTFLAAC